MSKALVVIALALGCSQPDAYTPRGIGVFTHGFDVSLDDIDAILGEVSWRAEELGYKVPDPHGLNMAFHAGPEVECAGQDHDDSSVRIGCWEPGWGSDDTIKVVYQACMGESALGHEFGHWITGDGGHPPDMFGCADSVEARTVQWACRELCGGKVCRNYDFGECNR